MGTDFVALRALEDIRDGARAARLAVMRGNEADIEAATRRIEDATRRLEACTASVSSAAQQDRAETVAPDAAGAAGEAP